MAHLLFSQEQDQPIKWFEKFDKEEIKTEIMKKETNVTVQDPTGNSSKTLLPAVPSRLVEVGQIITSKRTGKNLKCYNVMACYIGVENRFKHWEYSFWDEDKKKCKSIRHRVLQEWLNGVWSVVA